MGYEAKVLLDSRAPSGARLTTLEVTFPRIVLAEFNTHRMLSRNSASSRAIPVQKQIERVERDPFVPIRWGREQRGMQAREELSEAERRGAAEGWLSASAEAVRRARELRARGVHKQLVNRLLEPFMWHTVIVSATEWDNFFALRCHPDAQPEIREAAVLMRRARDASTPRLLLEHEWHLPLLREDEDLSDYTLDARCQISIGRCARVSYLTHEGKRDPDADLALCARLRQSGHMSPFEHVATPREGRWGNFVGWQQYRQFLPDEAVFRG